MTNPLADVRALVEAMPHELSCWNIPEHPCDCRRSKLLSALDAAAEQWNIMRQALTMIGGYDCTDGDYRHCPGCQACDANRALDEVEAMARSGEGREE